MISTDLYSILKHAVRNNLVNFKSIRKQNLPYIMIWIIYYAWVVAFTTWWTASPTTDEVFHTGIRSIVHIINLISSALFVLIIRKEWFVWTSRAGAILISVGMLLYLIVTNSMVQMISVTTIGIVLGVVNISILIPFVFSLNNTEKLYSVVGSNVLINLILLFQHGYLSGKQVGKAEHLLTFLILAVALTATIFFRKSSINQSDQDSMDAPEMNLRIYLTLVYNCVVAILCKGVGKGVLNITAQQFGNSISIWYYIGGLAGCIIYMAFYAMTKKAFILLSNVSFGSIAMGLLFNAFIHELPEMAAVFAVFVGIGSTIGMINMYYILAVVGKKYNNMRYIRMSIIFIGICGGVFGVAVGNLIDRINTVEASVFASIISVAFLLIFLMLSPLLAKAQYFNDWVKVSEEVVAVKEQDTEELFASYKLTKREIEVCKLLVEGYTLRQISAMLSIAYSTVNTYCTSSYRKLNINSRTELVILFKDYVKNNSDT